MQACRPGALGCLLWCRARPGRTRPRRRAQVLGTMLHELCHNEHGPHNAAFYKLLDEITAVRRTFGPRHPTARARWPAHEAAPRAGAQECDDYISRGIAGSGAGFDAASAGRLGGAGFGAHNPDPSQLRERMLKARAGGLCARSASTCSLRAVSWRCGARRSGRWACPARARGA